MFFDIYSESVFNRKNRENKRKNTNYKKPCSDKINGTKNYLFFLSQTPTHHNVTFNLRFL